MRALNQMYPLQSILWPQDNSLSKKIFLVLLGVSVLAFASQLSIPLHPVPLTFQSATVVLLGMAYGARYGVYIIATYLIAGALGAPIFADFSFGPTKFVGPTAGYLVSFLPAVFVSGYLTQKGFGTNFLRSFATAIISTSIIFGGGIFYLAQLIGFEKAILFGFTPFIFSECIKLIAVAWIAPRFWRTKKSS